MVKKEQNSDKQVTRISASDASTSKKSTPKTAKKVTAAKATDASNTKHAQAEPKNGGVLGSITGYFSGAWFELRQVRWPNRRATWSLTGAVIMFTAFFVLFIMLLDLLFSYVFEVILK